MYTKLHKEILTAEAYSLLGDTCAMPDFKEFYLVGGTALSLLLGHRKSDDLDLFSQKEFTTSIIQAIPKPYDINLLNRNSVEIFKAGTKIFFFFFAFPLQKGVLEIDGIRLANPIDIGLMKLLALQGRATKKDIIDLYFIDKNVLDLKELLSLFNKTYVKEKINTLSAIKFLMDEQSILEAPMPIMMTEFEWDVAYGLVRSKLIEFIKDQLL